MTSTTDPDLRSFIPVSTTSHFPIQNLPYGVFRPKSDYEARVGVAIGDYVLDLSVLEEEKLVDLATSSRLFAQQSLNQFMALGSDVWRKARQTISRLLRDDVAILRDDPNLRERAILPMASVEMLLPVEIGDYTDFYSSREHATNVGTMIRGPENALNPNWLQMPIAYHGRASSVVISGTDIRRPQGQRMPDGAEQPVFGPSRALDFELEMGFFIGPGNRLGEPIPIDQAWQHVFGMVLVNDWSARDIQRWEYQPLGPFLSKNFATSISPWVVPLEALQPFRVRGPQQNPTPLPYLQSPENTTFDVRLQAMLQAPKMTAPEIISSTNMRYLYWNIAQQVAHHTVSGCNLRAGDLLATGTISGPTRDSLGSMLEMTQSGKQPLQLANGESRQFIDDLDRVTLTGFCQGAGYRVGFGEVTGQILPAR